MSWLIVLTNARLTSFNCAISLMSFNTIASCSRSMRSNTSAVLGFFGYMSLSRLGDVTLGDSVEVSTRLLLGVPLDDLLDVVD